MGRLLFCGGAGRAGSGLVDGDILLDLKLLDPFAECGPGNAQQL